METYHYQRFTPQILPHFCSNGVIQNAVVEAHYEWHNGFVCRFIKMVRCQEMMLDIGPRSLWIEAREFIVASPLLRPKYTYQMKFLTTKLVFGMTIFKQIVTATTFPFTISPRAFAVLTFEGADDESTIISVEETVLIHRFNHFVDRFAQPFTPVEVARV